jgi:hypothetical protein
MAIESARMSDGASERSGSFTGGSLQEVLSTKFLNSSNHELSVKKVILLFATGFRDEKAPVVRRPVEETSIVAAWRVTRLDRAANEHQASSTTAKPN